MDAENERISRLYYPLEPCDVLCQCLPSTFHMLVPHYTEDGQKYPGDIQPGYYTRGALGALLRKHKHDPEAIEFIAQMMEEFHL